MYIQSDDQPFEQGLSGKRQTFTTASGQSYYNGNGKPLKVKNFGPVNLSERPTKPVTTTVSLAPMALVGRGANNEMAFNLAPAALAPALRQEVRNQQRRQSSASSSSPVTLNVPSGRSSFSLNPQLVTSAVQSPVTLNVPSSRQSSSSSSGAPVTLNIPAAQQKTSGGGELYTDGNIPVQLNIPSISPAAQSLTIGGGGLRQKLIPLDVTETRSDPADVARREAEAQRRRDEKIRRAEQAEREREQQAQPRPQGTMTVMTSSPPQRRIVPPRDQITIVEPDVPPATVQVVPPSGGNGGGGGDELPVEQPLEKSVWGKYWPLLTIAGLALAGFGYAAYRNRDKKAN